MSVIPALANPLGVCVFCGRQAKGFVVKFNPIAHIQKRTARESHLKKEYPQYSCCSTQCQNAVLKFVIGAFGTMPQETITQMEQKAILDAKHGLYDALVKIGVADAFNGQPPENMDFVIWSVWCAIRVSMHRQSEAGEIPF